ncbi:MAG TPA: EAL domain-containing protein [Burkholderiales bacterium]|nr:EAL domain-containing protein [Burkholderiales bacterium]
MARSDQKKGARAQAIDPESMRAGLAQGEFFLEYLPTVSLIDNRCIGAEALIRWKRPTGIVPPGEFIPLADNTPLSGLITYWVIDTVAAEMGDWLRAHPDAHISINVPVEILGRGGIAYVAGKAGLVELAPQMILEISERAVPDLLAVKALNDGGGLGVRIALDDFTHTASANLAVLARCNLHIVKFDRSLVSQITPQQNSPAWLDGIAGLIKSSGLQAVAEGVETEQQLAVLRNANIQAAQGFYFSRPIPAADFLVYYRSWR